MSARRLSPNVNWDRGADGDDEPEGSSFWREGPAEETEPLVDWARRPTRHAAVFLVLGGFGVFLEQASFLFQVVVGAPVFEELLKFGAALGLATLLGVESRPVRFGIALACGAAFGGLEHFLTYPGEPLAALRFRLAFHAGSPALSMATYDALHPVHDVRVRWAATVPATVLHWANNATALFLGLVGLAAGELAQGPALLVGQVVAGIVLGLAIAGLLLPVQLRRAVLTLWDRFAPRGLRTPGPDPPVRDLSRRDPGP
jgi:hypothetical protein